MDTELFTIIAPAACGVYMLWMITRWTTHSGLAGMIYQVLPFLTACASILASLKIAGVV